jgi:tetratricopeptide (TPR) repeat protein
MARNIHRPLVALAVASAALLAAETAWTQPAADAGAATAARTRRAGPISDADLRAAAAAMDEGRAALKRSNYRDAIALFNKVLAFPENQYSSEAQELVGLAYQRNGQLAQARAAYEESLRRYPTGDTADRVRQRLAGIVTAEEDKTAPLRAPGALPAKALPIGKFTKTDETTWTLVGGVSSFYIHDTAITNSRNTGLAPNVGATADDTQVHQNEILTSLDLLATWNSPSTSGKIRFNGGYEHRFDNVIQNGPSGDQKDQFGVSQASVDVVFKDLNLRTVAGRQTYNGDGVFGRFDGALFSWQALPMLKVDLDGGIPANSRYNLPFGLSGGVTNQAFFGGGIGIGPLFGGLDASIYYNEGVGHWLVNREAVGTDIKFADATKFAFVNIDYDLRFQQLNEAVLSGSWTLPNQATIYGGLDYRRIPFLSTWNVLLNSTSTTLYDFLKAQTAMGQPLSSDQVNQLALAQTPLYRSAMLGFSYPLNDKLTISADGTIANLNQTITPGSLLDPTLAQIASGNEYYATAQLIATNIFTAGDMYTTAFHYAQQSNDRQYFLDFNTRYPVNKDLIIGPRLRLGYSQYSSGAVLSNNVVTSTDLVQYTLMPSVLVDYNFNPNLTFEAEVGTQFTYGIQPGLKTRDTELFATIGFRYNFDLDGSKVFDRSKPASPADAAICRYTVRPDGTCSTQTSAKAAATNY